MVIKGKAIKSALKLPGEIYGEYGKSEPRGPSSSGSLKPYALGAGGFGGEGRLTASPYLV